jgi:hypothetical protein
MFFRGLINQTPAIGSEYFPSCQKEGEGEFEILIHLEKILFNNRVAKETVKV